MRHFVFFIIFLLLIACNKSQKIKDSKYDNSNIRIISLAPSITRELVELNQTNNLVGISSYCFIADSLKHLVLGNLIELNIEKILLLKPEIVFLTEMVNKSDLVTLQKHHIKTYVLPKLCSYNDIINNYMNIAKTVKQEKLAENKLKIYEKKLDSLTSFINLIKVKPKIFIQISSNPIFGVIPGTFMDDLIKFVGGINILSELKHPIVSKEYILLKNPDIIFIAIMDKPAIEELEKWKNYKNLKASQKNKIFIINPDTACQPTPSNFLYTLEKMIKLIYK